MSSDFAKRRKRWQRLAFGWTIVSVGLLGEIAWAKPGNCDSEAPLTALIDLGSNTYKTFEGGLYAGGSNIRPPIHEAAGVAIADSIVPLDVNGEPDPNNGAIVLISIGLSNMTQEWAKGAKNEPDSAAFTFFAKALELQSQGLINSKLEVIDGAIGGATVDDWSMPPNPMIYPWRKPLGQLDRADLSRFQVQVAAVKTATVRPTECIADDGSSRGNAGYIAGGLAQTARNLKRAFPNLKLLYIIPRSYGGYATTDLNPEPFAYEVGFAVKWVVNAQISQTGEYGNLEFRGANPPAPWLSYGPYLWANGETPNGQGLNWSREDFRADDGTHPSGSGVNKASDVFLDFFIHDTTTRPWFLSSLGRCDADLNHSDAVDAADVVQLLGAWGPCGTDQTCPADFDVNGRVDVRDLFVLLNRWGECPL